MEIMEIIKEAFVFPSNDIGKLAIYIVLTVLVTLLAGGGVFSIVFGSMGESAAYSAIGVILFVISLIIGFILSGYQVGIIKSGIDKEEAAPAFDWIANLVTGIKYLIVNIIYFIIPALIVLVIGLITNVPGNMYAVIQDYMINSVNATAVANTTTPVVSSLSSTLVGNLVASLTITGLVAVILFILFAFIQTMGVARLANTGSLSNSLNIIEAFKDIGRIGWGKVIGTVILILIVILAINLIISGISYYISAFGIVSIIVTPYLVFFAARATGLLYSDIA